MHGNGGDGAVRRDSVVQWLDIVVVHASINSFH